MIDLAIDAYVRMQQVNRHKQPHLTNIVDYLFTLSSYIKSVIVVDEDIDPSNLMEVRWAQATRCQPASDVVIETGLPGSIIDPSCLPTVVTSKIGYDATVPRSNRGIFRKVDFPSVAKEKASLIVQSMHA